MDKAVMNGIVLAVASGLLAFLGALGGTTYQSHIAFKQKLLEEKRIAYGKAMSKVGILPVYTANPSMINSLSHKTNSQVNLFDPLDDPLWQISQEKLIEIQESLAAAQLLADEPLAVKIAILINIVEIKRRNDIILSKGKKRESPYNPHSKEQQESIQLLLRNREELKSIFMDIRVLMRNELIS